MTAEEAIEILRQENKEDSCKLVNTPKIFTKRRAKIAKRFSARISAIVALRTTNKEKPIEGDDTLFRMRGSYYCPSCGFEVDGDRCCSNCGQAIDWRVEE